MANVAAKDNKAIVALQSGRSSVVRLQRTLRQHRKPSSHRDKDTDVSVTFSNDSHKTASTNAVAPSARIENTYKTRPDVVFNVSEVESIAESMLVQRLKNVAYEPYYCKILSQELAASLMERLKALEIKRYKLVAIVSIGSLKERPGLQFGSRCLWNNETDSVATVKFTNGSLFAVANIYAMYYE